MDEIEYRLAYNSACNAVDKMTDPNAQQALRLLLQIIDGHQQNIEEMQTAEDEDEC